MGPARKRGNSERHRSLVLRVRRGGRPIHRDRHKAGVSRPCEADTSCRKWRTGRCVWRNGKFYIVVDDDVDITNLQDVIWAMATRCDPGEAIDIVRGVWTSPADPAIRPSK